MTDDALSARILDLNQRAWRLIQAYRTGSQPREDVKREAAALQKELNGVDLSTLSEDARRRHQKSLTWLPVEATRTHLPDRVHAPFESARG